MIELLASFGSALVNQQQQSRRQRKDDAFEFGGHPSHQIGNVDDLDELTEEEVVWGECTEVPRYDRRPAASMARRRPLLSEEIARAEQRGHQQWNSEARHARDWVDEEERVGGGAEPQMVAGPGYEGGSVHMIVPPHEMVAREYRSTSPSVLQGAGRTLKGMDLCRVRNAVWSQTGFED